MELVTEKIKTYSSLVMFEHTIFALPFAYLALFLASGGWPSFHDFFWITVAMIGARNGANAWNRVADHKIDKLNPRTASRELPSGKVNKLEVIFLTIICFLFLLLAALNLNPICLKLLPLAIVFVCFYSYTKRFTWACHLYLGAAVALAPLGAWIAVAGKLTPGAIMLASIHGLWVAGFDIIYATQDYYFDKKNDYFYFSKPFLSRLSSYVVKINPPSFELKKNFFIKKINKQLGLNVKNCDKNINEQIDFLLCSIEADFRLVDMYTQYVIDSYLIYKNIEAALKNVLTKYFKYGTKDKQTFTRLHYLTNKISECTNTDIVALAKKRRIQRPDELILLDLTVYVLREISNISLKDIANFFNKDKSSISKKCKNFKQRLESGDKTAKYYLDILIEEDAIK